MLSPMGYVCPWVIAKHLVMALVMDSPPEAGNDKGGSCHAEPAGYVCPWVVAKHLVNLMMGRESRERPAVTFYITSRTPLQP